MHIVLSYRSTGNALALDVPALDGMTAEQVAAAAYAVTTRAFVQLPSTGRVGPAARHISAAYYTGQRAGGVSMVPMHVGDRVHAAGAVLQLATERTGEPDAWGHYTPTFRTLETFTGCGSGMALSGRVAPPDQIAYAEDCRDRLWTGRGAGIWTCLRDPAGRTAPVSWWKAWEQYGPLVPLVPATVTSPEFTAV